MIASQKNISYVRYEFSANELEGVLTSSRNDIERSVEKYIRLCEKSLQREYPNAEIEIANTNQAEISTSTLVYNKSGDEIHSENEIVETLCQQVYNKFDWVVSKNLVPISELSTSHTDLPRSLVRWACNQDLIDGAGKPYGYWDVPLKMLLQLNKHIEIIINETDIATSSHQLKAGYLEEVGNVALMQIPEQVKLLLATRHGFETPFFEADTSAIFVSRKSFQAHIIVEHFVDIKKWKHPEWPYPQFADELIKQAKKKGIECKFQTDVRDRSETIDGVSFHFVEAIETGASLETLVSKVLSCLTEVVEVTELSLVGGPDIGNPIYQNNEDRFCKDVLEPLLNKMKFDYIRYTHGTKEYGRDFYFEYNTPFGKPISFGIQVKRGDLRGRANAEISTILEQIERAFENPYIKKDDDLNTEVNISIMIVAISGKFTDDAVQVIRSKLSRYFPKGSVYFWDKHTIQDLIALYWGRSNK